PTSILIVATKEGIEKSSQNLSGVDITKPHHLNIEHLAPGGIAGRLTVFTKSALAKIGGAK
ncbi:MAG TPA: 50S ribosomal protein L4, partial [Thermoplasmatales archaeon]|nr:50S ribosomal protein L4 [Thermoplasmatales archaeon]